MTQFIAGLDRQQTMLLPEHLDDYVDTNSPVRAIDTFTDMLDLASLGFNTQPAATGRPGYRPVLMLWIYIYGYLNQVQSSRRLERECGLNLELIWLTGRLKPDFKTIADKGYYKGEEIVASKTVGISVVVPKPMTSNAAACGQFDKADFAYDSDQDVYVCPAGYRFTGQQDGKAIRSYWFGACADCSIKDKCTTGKERRVRCWEKEDVLERVQDRLDADPAQLAVRSMTVEHPTARSNHGWELFTSK